jgi:hypothetical protein
MLFGAVIGFGLLHGFVGTGIRAGVLALMCMTILCEHPNPGSYLLASCGGFPQNHVEAQIRTGSQNGPEQNRCVQFYSAYHTRHATLSHAELHRRLTRCQCGPDNHEITANATMKSVPSRSATTVQSFNKKPCSSGRPFHLPPKQSQSRR